MKNLTFCLALVALFIVGMSTSEAKAQCGVRSFVSVNSGFSSNVFVPQSVVVPQSTAFFSGGNVAFINTPQAFAFAQPAFVNVASPVVQQVNVRRGLFGNVRRVQVNSFAQPAAVVVGGHSRGFVNVNVGRTRVFVR